MKVLVTGCLKLLKDIYIYIYHKKFAAYIRFFIYQIFSCSFSSILSLYIYNIYTTYIYVLYVLFNFVNYVFLLCLCILILMNVLFCIFCLLCCSMYFCVKMCTLLLPPGVNPNAVDTHVMSYHITHT